MDVPNGNRTVTRLRESISSKQQTGVTLVELMVAVVVALLLIAGLIQIYLTSKQSYNAQAELARMQEAGRFATDLITRDLRRAGYWGGNVDTTTIEGAPGRETPVRGLCPGPGDEWPRMIAWRVSGWDNTDAGGYACAGARLADTDILTIRYAGPEAIDEASIAATDTSLYLRSTLFAGRVMLGSNKDAAENILPPIGASTPDHLVPQVRALVAHGYYIANSQGTCNGNPIPGLWRVRLAPGGTLTTEEVAPGIEQFQVRYLVNDTYLDAHQVGNNWPNVRAVRIWLLARSSCPEAGLQNAPSYDMGNVTNWPNSPDNFRRQLYVATVMLRNTLVR